MRVVLAVFRDDRPPNDSVGLEVCECCMVAMPDREASFSQLRSALQLSPQESGNNVTRQIRRAYVDPRVFVDLSAEKRGAIRALFANNFCPMNEYLVSE